MDTGLLREFADRIDSLRAKGRLLLRRIRPLLGDIPEINRLSEKRDQHGRIWQDPNRAADEREDAKKAWDSLNARVTVLWEPFQKLEAEVWAFAKQLNHAMVALPVHPSSLRDIRQEIQLLRFPKSVFPDARVVWQDAVTDLEILDQRFAEILDIANAVKGNSETKQTTASSERDKISVMNVSGLTSSDTRAQRVDWKHVRDLDAGGQGLTDVVCRSDDPEKQEFIRKRLKNIDNPARRARFESELKAYLTLAHENILRLVDFDLNAPRPYIVSEYCRRGSLDGGNWTRGTVLEVLQDFRQICCGVAYAHENGVVHRDIKPANIFSRDNGSLVVGDFGLCLLDDQGVRVTATEEVVGSRFYTAPELADGRADRVRPSCDVYSLGKLLYWMLTGRVFDREKHRDDEWRFGRSGLPLPQYELVNQLLDRMIAADPWQRHQSAAVTLAAVEGLMGVIDKGGHAIDLGTSQLCSFCAQGVYRIVVDGLKSGSRLGRTYQEIACDDASSVFGLRAPAAGVPTQWLIMVCEACGHVQVFRPDLMPEALKKWQRKPPSP